MVVVWWERKACRIGPVLLFFSLVFRVRPNPQVPRASREMEAGLDLERVRHRPPWRGGERSGETQESPRRRRPQSSVVVLVKESTPVEALFPLGGHLGKALLAPPDPADVKGAPDVPRQRANLGGGRRVDGWRVLGVGRRRQGQRSGSTSGSSYLACSSVTTKARDSRSSAGPYRCRGLDSVARLA